MTRFANIPGATAAGRKHADIAAEAVEAARKPMDIDDFTREAPQPVLLLAGNEAGHASATNANVALTNNEVYSSMATSENSSASINPQENQHTPGPWYFSGVDDREEPTEGYIRSKSAGDELIAAVFAKQDIPVIAAATELLAALEKLCPLTHRADCKGLRSRYAIAQEEYCTCGAADARAAIAKAKGGAQ